MKTLRTSFREIITEYHRLFALTKKKEYLEAAEEVSNIDATDFQELWEKKVNEGCLREGLPLRYPQAGEITHH